MNNFYTLKEMAQMGHVMGLRTIGEVYNHMVNHYDAYFEIAKLGEEIEQLDALTEGHSIDCVSDYLSDEDIQQIEAELDKALSGGCGCNEPEEG